MWVGWMLTFDRWKSLHRSSGIGTIARYRRFDRRKALPMYFTRTVCLQCHQMLLGWITFVAIESIQRKELMQPHHFGIACCFGQNRSSGNFGNQAIAIDNRARRAVQLRNLVAIDQRQIRKKRQLRDCSLHGEQTCLQNIEPVYFLYRCRCNRPCNGIAFDGNRERIPLFLAQLLRIGKPVNGMRGIQNNACGINRPCQRASSCLVDSATNQLIDAGNNRNETG